MANTRRRSRTISSTAQVYDRLKSTNNRTYILSVSFIPLNLYFLYSSSFIYDDDDDDDEWGKRGKGGKVLFFVGVNFLSFEILETGIISDSVELLQSKINILLCM